MATQLSIFRVEHSRSEIRMEDQDVADTITTHRKEQNTSSMGHFICLEVYCYGIDQQRKVPPIIKQYLDGSGPMRVLHSENFT